jgi:hypothetical protein
MATRETDPVSGHRLESTTYRTQPKVSYNLEAFLISSKLFIFIYLWVGNDGGRKKAGVAHCQILSITPN